jgi:hypothetical protein
MSINSLPSERAAVVATIDPDVYTQAAYVSDYVDMGKWDSLLAVIMAGTLGSSATLNAKLVQATTSGGSGKKDISGKAIAALTQGGTDSDKQALINLRAEELDVDNDFQFVAIEMTIGTATSDAGAVLFGFDGRYLPASDSDLASVDEIVN